MKITILYLLTSVLFWGCLKKDGSCLPKTVQSEEASILAYASSHGMNVTRNSSGMYYEVTNPGTGATPSLSSRVSVQYVGKLMDDTIFDQSTTPTSLYPLSGYITGWQIGLPLISKGGSIRLLIPSSLAYGCIDQGRVPANAILYFDVQLVDVQ
jgi:FKBP-type peptidyl-prolyl cis-trans isomerase FkpA